MVKWFETIPYKIEVRKIAIITFEKYLVISAKQILILNVATVKRSSCCNIFFFLKSKKNTISQLNETKDDKVKFLSSLLKMLPTLV